MNVIKGGLCRDTVDQDEPLSILHVQVSHGSELLGTSSIQDLQHTLLPVNLSLLKTDKGFMIGRYLK